MSRAAHSALEQGWRQALDEESGIKIESILLKLESVLIDFGRHKVVIIVGTMVLFVVIEMPKHFSSRNFHPERRQGV